MNPQYRATLDELYKNDGDRGLLQYFILHEKLTIDQAHDKLGDYKLFSLDSAPVDKEAGEELDRLLDELVREEFEPRPIHVRVSEEVRVFEMPKVGFLNSLKKFFSR